MTGIRSLIVVLLSAVVLTFGTNAVTAATPLKNKGLLITPVRQYTNVDAGLQKAGGFSVANLTGQPAVITLSVKQFSVTDYAYDYRFNEPDNNWLRLSVPEVALKSGESRKIAYTIVVPKGTAPGGHYYTLFASAEVADDDLHGTVQAATLLYLTVNGRLVQTSQLRASRMPRWAFGREISYALDIANTGNVHYFAYISGQLHGISARKTHGEAPHLLLPQKTRRLSESIPAPRLPGIYKATYGYRTEGPAPAQTKNQYIIYLPPWSIAALLLLLLGVAKWHQRRKADRRQGRVDYNQK